jgi:hypothetical protein
MNSITFKGLLLRMFLAFTAISAVLHVYPARSSESRYAPPAVGKIFTHADALAQAHRRDLPAAPTIEEHQRANERVRQLRGLHPSEPDAIGNIRPMAPYQPRLEAPAFGQWNDQDKE